MSAVSGVDAAAMLALAEPVARAASGVDPYSVSVSDLGGSGGAGPLVEVVLQVRHPREVLLLAERLGLTLKDGPPTLLMYAREWPEQRCRVEVFCGVPSRTEPAPSGSQAPGVEARRPEASAAGNGRPGG